MVRPTRSRVCLDGTGRSCAFSGKGPGAVGTGLDRGREGRSSPLFLCSQSGTLMGPSGL